MLIPVSWPFDPKKTPFFYGWVIWIFSTLGFLLSVPGQTMGMAVFTDQFIEIFSLSRTELSMAYLFGTIGSAFFLTRAGRWFDLYGGRIMIPLSAFALGVMVFYFSTVDEVLSVIQGPSWVTFCLVLFGFFGVRFFGQGVLTSCSRNLLLPWFVKRRGLVSGIRNVFTSFGFSIAPLGIAGLIAFFGWRETLWFMAIVVGLVFPALALIFIRDDPASCGLLPDGENPSESENSPRELISLGLSEARRSPVFWIYSLSLGMHALFGTALTFHVVAIFSESGLSRDVALGYFLPVAVFSTSANLLASWFVDNAKLKPFLILMLGSFILGSFGFINLDAGSGYWILAAGFGMGGGLWGVVSNLAFIRFFGPGHVGEVSGFSTSISVFASALGPFVFSLAVDVLGSYVAAAKICLLVLFLLLFLALIIPQRELKLSSK
ncbi:MAG: MFS transporter [Gammaproteobacteria bacterium]|nr:MFS transporter [Gammaproteobacteria bacterium]